VVRAGTAWKKTLKDKDWTDLTERGNDFKAFISDQTVSVTKLLVSLGLA
jgi:tripartite-type tricarboxylate transporter receptor subunit TctC